MPDAPMKRTINRELSWLSFNRRVLWEATNQDNPPFERLKFMAISASNLDEFFMVRVASLHTDVKAGKTGRDICGMTPAEQLPLVLSDARAFMAEQAMAYREHALPILSSAGLAPLTLEAAGDAGACWAEQCFMAEIVPKLKIAALEKGKPLPPLKGRTLYMGFLIQGDKKEETQIYMAPLSAGLRRVYPMPKALGEGMFLMETLVAAFAAALFPGRKVLGCWPFRITRDEDFTVGDSPAADLLRETKKSLRKRATGDVVRLSVDAKASILFLERFCTLLSIGPETVFSVDAPLNLTFLWKEIYALRGFGHLKFPPFTGIIPKPLLGASLLFDILKKRDIFLHHPYDSFDTVLRFVREAARDPRVLAIKQTLYRVSGQSPVIRALCDAAEAGKKVTVLLELKARFDEENNIRWGMVLEKAGCQVIYGLPQVKTHSKITLVVRREEGGLCRYVHLGTGNYNDVTAKQYTDMGLLTADGALGRDAQAFFNMITGFSKEPRMHKLICAPSMLRKALTEMIAWEGECARQGLPCGITAKMNALADPGIIEALYEASQAGVPIRLNVRGVCCLRPGVPGLSDNIQVRSLVGRFLEHSRVFRFENGGEPRLFLASADWMPRNLNRRVELMFPIESPQVAGRIQRVLRLQWQDTENAWELLPDGTYRRACGDGEKVDAQEALFGQG